MDIKFIQESDPQNVNPDKVTFIFSLNWIDSTHNVINLDFKEPEYVSSFSTKDRLKVTFNDTSIFKTESGAPIDDNIVLEFELPR